MIGQRIRYYRKTNGLTQEELARGICSVSYLSKIENGDAKSSEDVIELLCERLGISPKDKQIDVNIIGMLNEWNHLMVERKHDEVTVMKEKIDDYLPIIEDPQLLIRYDLFLARYYITHKKIEEANEIIKKLDQLDKTHFDGPLKFYYNLIKGLYNYIINEYNESLKYFEEAEHFVQYTPLTQLELATYYYSLALTHTALYHNTSVINYAYKSLTIFDKEYNYTRSADCQILLGIVNRRINNYSQAVHHFKQALKFAESFNDKRTLGIIYHNLGLVFSNKKESEKAIECYLKSTSIKEGSEDKTIFITYYLLAMEFFNLNKFEESRSWLEKMDKHLETIQQLRQKDNLIHYNVLKMRLNNATGKEYESFLKKEVIPYFQDKNIMEFVCKYATLLAEYYYENSQYKNSSEYYKLALQAGSNFS
ncbi:helix-turn-helix domain-containing protein [Pseudalkalibacillus sp. SCS-8]|uniref:helix-turn-helix domain-containing protein n=1 Tax=Pseudalkalibacillus nanhaiensis TaxID=3115291 RepID=UPI0032DBBE7C